MSVKRFLLRIDKKEYLQSLANGHIFCNRIAKFRKMPTENSKIADSNEGLAKEEEISHITINDLVLNVIGPVRFYYPDYFPIFCAYEFEGISTTKGIQGIVDLSFIEEMKKEKNTSSAIIIEKEPFVNLLISYCNSKKIFIRCGSITYSDSPLKDNEKEPWKAFFRKDYRFANQHEWRFLLDNSTDAPDMIPNSNSPYEFDIGNISKISQIITLPS